MKNILLLMKLTSYPKLTSLHICKDASGDINHILEEFKIHDLTDIPNHCIGDSCLLEFQMLND
jgi:hypothetical protein